MSLHFDKGQTPPVNAFWSTTMYNAKQAFVANPINRYAIGDRDRLKFNKDGSLDIYIQHDSPGKDKESNWLPADAGSFNVVMRLYWPKETGAQWNVDSSANQEGELGNESGSAYLRLQGLQRLEAVEGREAYLVRIAVLGATCGRA